jgi:hypothetical protein
MRQVLASDSESEPEEAAPPPASDGAAAKLDEEAATLDAAKRELEASARDDEEAPDCSDEGPRPDTAASRPDAAASPGTTVDAALKSFMDASAEVHGAKPSPAEEAAAPVAPASPRRLAGEIQAVIGAAADAGALTAKGVRAAAEPRRPRTAPLQSVTQSPP